MDKLLREITAERASAVLVCGMGAFVGAYAAYGLKHGVEFALTPAQWAGAVVGVGGAILLAVVVHTRPEPVKTTR
jgi:hypothetical protein